MGRPPGRSRSGCPYGPPSFGPPLRPASHAGFFRRPAQPAAGSLRRRPEVPARCAVPCPRHSRPSAGSQYLQPEAPVRCAPPSRRFSRPAAGSLCWPMQDLVLPIPSFRSYRHPPIICLNGRLLHPLQAGDTPARRAVLFRAADWVLPVREMGDTGGPLPRPSRSLLPSSVSHHEVRVNGASTIKG